MLRRNLMFIALAIFTIGLTSHAFGQGQATGRRQHKPLAGKSPRDVSSGQASRKKSVYGDVHPGEGDMGTGMVKGNPQTTTNRRTKNRKPFFRPNPAGDGTTEQVVTGKKPQAQNENKLGNFEIQGLKTPKRNRRQTPKSVGFPDYTDDAATTQIQPGQTGGGTISNQSQKRKPNQQTRREKRQHKP